MSFSPRHQTLINVDLSPIKIHTMNLLWDKSQLILPLYMKQISFQSKASVVCSVTAAIFINFCLKILNVFSQHFGQKTNEHLNSAEQIPKELKCWSTVCVIYILRYYLMMQHQPIVKRVNETHEWAHRPYQLLSAPYHCCLYKHGWQNERQPLQSSWPVPICTWTYLSQVTSFMQLGMLCLAFNWHQSHITASAQNINS